MQKHAFLFFTLFALALSGCNGKETASPTHTAEGVSRTTVAEPPARVSGQPSLLSETKPQPTPSAPDLAVLAIGERVYKGTCSICHKSGLNGAPRMGSKKDWEPRIAKGKKVLYSNSINGYRGKNGSMPSRGSNPRLSEAEVRAAVDYIVEHAIPAWSTE